MIRQVKRDTATIAVLIGVSLIVLMFFEPLLKGTVLDMLTSDMDTASKLSLYMTTFVPFTICCIAFKGMNNRIMLAVVMLAMAAEFIAYDFLFTYSWNNSHFLLFLFAPMLTTMISTVAIFYRVPLCFAVGKRLVKLGVNNIGGKLLFATRFTRQDVYLRMSMLAYTALTVVLVAPRLVWYFSLTGPINQDTFSDQYYASSLPVYSQLTSIASHHVTYIEIVMFVYIAIREYKQPDGLYNPG